MKKLKKYLFISLIALTGFCYADACPTIINDAQDLINFSNCVNQGNNMIGQTITLTNDIDLKGVQFDPIASNMGVGFRGAFDGQKHTIKNLSLVVTDENMLYGLFGYINGGSVMNLKLDNVQISGAPSSRYTVNAIGTLAGIIEQGQISNISVNGQIDLNGTAQDLEIGGLVGVGDHLEVKNCSSAVDIIAHTISSPFEYPVNNGIGGLIGDIYSADINSSYAMGNITIDHEALQAIGGLVGIAFGDDNGTTNIKNSFSSGIINPTTSESSIGLAISGLVGLTYQNTSARNPDITISNNYSNTKLSNCSDKVTCNGIGSTTIRRPLAPQCTNSYWDIQATGTKFSSICGSGGESTSTMKSKATYEGWNFSSVWAIDGSNNGYPYLLWVNQ